MIYLIASIILGAMVALVLRVSEGKVRARISMLGFNYLSCTIIAILTTGVGQLFPNSEYASLTLAMGAVNGVFYLAGLALMQHNIRLNGVTLPSVFSRLGGLLVPMLVAVLAFHEMPTPVQLAGAIIAVASIILINYNKDGGQANAKWLLIVLLLFEGAAAAMSKIFNMVSDSALSGQFLLYTFGMACLLCLCVAIVTKERPGLRELMFGVMIGVPNYFSSRLLLKALEEIPAVICYPMRGVSSIVIITLVGVLCFGERLKKHQWAAMGMILAAVVLLNL